MPNTPQRVKSTCTLYAYWLEDNDNRNKKNGLCAIYTSISIIWRRSFVTALFGSSHAHHNNNSININAHILFPIRNECAKKICRGCRLWDEISLTHCTTRDLFISLFFALRTLVGAAVTLEEFAHSQFKTEISIALNHIRNGLYTCIQLYG